MCSRAQSGDSAVHGGGSPSAACLGGSGRRGGPAGRQVATFRRQTCEEQHIFEERLALLLAGLARQIISEPEGVYDERRVT